MGVFFFTFPINFFVPDSILEQNSMIQNVLLYLQTSNCITRPQLQERSQFYFEVMFRKNLSITDVITHDSPYTDDIVQYLWWPIVGCCPRLYLSLLASRSDSSSVNMSPSRTGPFTLRMIDRFDSSINSTRTCVHWPCEPVRPRIFVTFASLIGAALASILIGRL